MRALISKGKSHALKEIADEIEADPFPGFLAKSLLSSAMMQCDQRSETHPGPPSDGVYRLDVDLKSLRGYNQPLFDALALIDCHRILGGANPLHEDFRRTGLFAKPTIAKWRLNPVRYPEPFFAKGVFPVLELIDDEAEDEDVNPIVTETRRGTPDRESPQPGPSGLSGIQRRAANVTALQLSDDESDDEGPIVSRKRTRTPDRESPQPSAAKHRKTTASSSETISEDPSTIMPSVESTSTATMDTISEEPSTIVANVESTSTATMGTISEEAVEREGTSTSSVSPIRRPTLRPRKRIMNYRE